MSGWSLSARLLLLLPGSVLIGFAFAMLAFVQDQRATGEHFAVLHAADRAALLVQAQLRTGARLPLDINGVRVEAARPPAGEPRITTPFARALTERLPGSRMLEPAADAPLAAVLEVPALGAVRISVAPPASEPRDPPPLLAFATTALVGVLAGLVGAWWLIRPLRTIEAAAQAIDTKRPAVHLPESGAREVVAVKRALNQLQQRIHEQTRERVVALSAMSHDLKLPLTRARLRLDQMDGPAALSGAIERDLEAMSGLIDATIDHVQTLDHAEPVEAIDLHALIEAVADDFSEQGHRIVVEGPAIPPVLGQLRGLRRCFENLVDNALKYAGAVHIELDVETPWSVVRVVDSGPGLAAAEPERLFEPFVRGTGAREQAPQGQGLGLAIVKSIVTANGGTLEASTSASGGLTMTIRLPLAGARTGDVLAKKG